MNTEQPILFHHTVVSLMTQASKEARAATRLFYRKLLPTLDGEPAKLSPRDLDILHEWCEANVMLRVAPGWYALNPKFVRFGAPEPTFTAIIDQYSSDRPLSLQ